MRALARLRGYGSTGTGKPNDKPTGDIEQSAPELPAKPWPRPQRQHLNCAHDHAAGSRHRSVLGLPAIFFLTAILAIAVLLNVAYVEAVGFTETVLRALGTLLAACAFASAVLCIATDPGSPYAHADNVPPQRPIAEEDPQLASSRKREQKLDDGEVWVQKYCLECELWRPYGAGHCRYCNRCILQLDHHCFVLGTCIGEHNQVFFDLLLVFGGLGLLCFFSLGLRCYFLQGWWHSIGCLHFLILADFILAAGSSGLILTSIGMCKCFNVNIQLCRTAARK